MSSDWTGRHIQHLSAYSKKRCLAQELAYLKINVTRSALRAYIVDDSNVGSCRHRVLASSIPCALDLQGEQDLSSNLTYILSAALALSLLFDSQYEVCFGYSQTMSTSFVSSHFEMSGKAEPVARMDYQVTK